MMGPMWKGGIGGNCSFRMDPTQCRISDNKSTIVDILVEYLANITQKTRYVSCCILRAETKLNTLQPYRCD